MWLTSTISHLLLASLKLHFILTVQVQLEQAEYNVCEGVGVLTVCAVVTGGSFISSFTLATGTSGTATGTNQVFLMNP